MLNWYAAYTRSQSERKVNNGLRDRGYETCYPHTTHISRWSDRRKEIERPLFPGYLFVRCDWDWLPVLQTPGVVYLVSIAGRPVAVPDVEVESLMVAMASGLELEPVPYQVGDRVRIEHGPLCGAIGTVVRSGREQRIIVSVEMLGKSVSVKTMTDWLRKESQCQPAQRFLAHAAEF